MKKILLIVILLLCCCTSAFAEQKEWVDKNFDFKKVGGVLIFYDYQPSYDGISEYETEEIFFSTFEKKTNGTLGRNVRFANLEFALDLIRNERNIDIDSLRENNPMEYRKIVDEYIKENYDIGIKVSVIKYEMGTQYFEGYTIDVPDTETSHVITPYGNATVYTNKTKQQHISGGNAPVAYCVVAFNAYRIPDGKPVWNRIDSRARANRSIMENSKPKDLYERIVESYASDFRKRLKS